MAVIDAMHIDRASLFQIVSSMIKETGKSIYWAAREYKDMYINFTRDIYECYECASGIEKLWMVICLSFDNNQDVWRNDQ